jgi:hypothetical protein
MLMAVWEPTSEVLIGKVALVEPAGMVTVGGTVTEVSCAPSDTTAPPAGAGPLSVTVPVEEFPPTTVLGFNVSVEGVGPSEPVGFSTSVVDCVWPPPVTEIVTFFVPVVGAAWTLKLPVVDPCGIVTPLLIVTSVGSLHVSASVSSYGSGEAIVTRPEAPREPLLGSPLGHTLIEVGGACGPNITCACAVMPLYVAVIVTGVLVVTRLVGALGPPEKKPGWMVNVEGTVTAGELLDRLTVAPLGPAAPVRFRKIGSG